MKKVGPDAYVIDISSYKGLAVIPDDLFDEPFHDLTANPMHDPKLVNLPSTCKNILMLFWMNKLFPLGTEEFSATKLIGRDDPT